MRKPSEELLKAIGELSEDLIAEASEESLELEKKKRKKKIIFISSGAAVAAAVLFLVVLQVFPIAVDEKAGAHFLTNVAMDWKGDAAYEAATEATNEISEKKKDTSALVEKHSSEKTVVEKGVEAGGVEIDPDEIDDQSVADYKNHSDSTTLDEENMSDSSESNNQENENHIASTSDPSDSREKTSFGLMPKDEEKSAMTKPSDEQEKVEAPKPTVTPKPTPKPETEKEPESVEQNEE